MTRYVRLDADTTQQRSFTITVALVEGYHDGRTWSLDDAVVAAIGVHGKWMSQQISQGRPYLTGLFTASTLSYAWHRLETAGDSTVRSEPALVFSGEVSVLYQAWLHDLEVEAMLDELAARFGEAFGQTRVYLTYRFMAWVLQDLDREAVR